ncbi:MAG: DUF2806 domain-containing protein [Chloroflexota bacterium]
MEIDLSSKFLEKLVDTVSKGIGRVTKAHFARRDADAEAYRIRLLAAAEADAKRFMASGELSAEKILSELEESNAKITVQRPEDIPLEEIRQLAERAESREEYQKLKQQHNTEQIINNAVEDGLENPTDVSDESVDEDWINNFFEMGKNISNEEMQLYWGKILAGEVKKPGTFSLRFLQLLRGLTKQDAILVQNLANISIISASVEAFIMSYDYRPPEYYGLSNSDILHLQDIGMLNSKGVEITIGSPTEFVFENCGHVIRLAPTESGSMLTYEVIRLTKVGFAFLQIVTESTPNMEYIQSFAYPAKQRGFTVEMGKIVARDNKQILFNNLKTL